ncbi:MAG: hypothetical protein AAF270_03065 [Pseudomonadota bacterium]
MDKKTWEQVEDAFAQAVALPEDARADFVREISTQQLEVARKLVDLLAAESDEDERIRTPIAKTAQAYAGWLDTIERAGMTVPSVGSGKSEFQLEHAYLDARTIKEEEREVTVGKTNASKQGTQ